MHFREAVKYYFADFVRKGGTPPFTDKIFDKKGVTDMGGTPPCSKMPEMVFFAQKTPVFFVKKKKLAGDSRHLAKKKRRLPFLGEPILFLQPFGGH